MHCDDPAMPHEALDRVQLAAVVILARCIARDVDVVPEVCERQPLGLGIPITEQSALRAARRLLTPPSPRRSVDRPITTANGEGGEAAQKHSLGVRPDHCRRALLRTLQEFSL